MNSLVNYDDSDSETEDDRSPHTPQVPKALPMNLVQHQPQSNTTVPSSSPDSLAGTSSFGSLTTQYPVHVPNYSSAYKGLSNSTMKVTVLPPQKRYQPSSEGVVKPYVPKRLRQDQSNLAVEVKGGDSVTSQDLISHSARNIYRVSDYIGPHLPLKYQSSGIPTKVIFRMKEHAGPVNRVQWCPMKEFSNLLLSASMDGTCK
ncbi:hypothetical protein GDO81_023490, partial [Engystomops pustulosus]